MNIKSEELGRILDRERAQGQLSPLWIIVGEEPLLAMEAGDALRFTAKELGYSERVVLAMSSVSDWSPLLDAVSSVSLFDDKKIIELRFLSSGPGVKGAKVLAQFAELVPQIDSTVTVIHLTQTDYSTQKTTWFKNLAASGHVISCQPVSRAQYPAWIKERLRKQGQSMQEQALNFFAEQTEGNLMAAKQELMKLDLLYPCYCTRSQLHSVNAPHLSDGTYVYPGTCRNLTDAQRAAFSRSPAWRVKVPDKIWRFTDLVQGEYSLNLATDCGDMVVRRADGVYVYQLAVTVDDGEAGVTEVVRGMDLLSSAPRQMYLQELFGFSHPVYAHVPMLLAPDGRRLSKRNRDLDLGQLKLHFQPEQILGTLAHAAGVIDRPCAVSAEELIGEFSWQKVKKTDICLDASLLLGQSV